MSPQTQPILTPDEIEKKIVTICERRNDITRYELEQDLHKMTKSNNQDIMFNGYIGLAHLAVTVDHNMQDMQNYMDKLGLFVTGMDYYANYAAFLLRFDRVKEAKEKLLLALDYPVELLEDFKRLAATAMALKDDEVDEKILDKCKSFSKTKEYTEMKQELIYRKENIHKIEQMALFENDWNGNGGEKFTPEAIAYFRNIIQKLDKQPDIAPTGRNSLFIQYELNNNILAFEIAVDKTEKVYVPNEDYSHAQVEQFSTDVISKIQDSVKNFYEQR